MPYVEMFGHFAVVSSVTTNPRWQWGGKRLGLLEIYPDKLNGVKVDRYNNNLSIRIDPRMPCVKRVIFKSREFKCWTKDKYNYDRKFTHYRNVAEQFEKLWPCHMLSRFCFPPDAMG